jgi:argininosuccinate lyase
VETVTFHPEAMRSAAEADGLYATDLAEALVRGGEPFRTAHRRTGELLRDLADAKRSLHDLSAGEWAAFGLPDGASLLDPDLAVRARAAPGGPSPDSVGAQADAIDRLLGERRAP